MANLRTTTEEILGAVLLIFVGCLPLLACDPEPGPNHFYKVSYTAPNPPPPPLRTGIFEVYNTQRNLPCDRIRCLLMMEDGLLAGSDGAGLMIYRNQTWTAYHPSSQPSFPSQTVGALAPGMKPGTFLAGIPQGMVEIRFESEKPVFTFTPLVKGSSNILCLSPSGGELLVGTDAEAGKFTGQGLQAFHVGDSPSVAGFSVLNRSRDGEWLFGSEAGLFVLRGDALWPLQPGAGTFGWVRALLSEKELTLVGGSGGLFGFRKAFSELLPGVWVTALAGQGLETCSLFKPGVDSQSPAMAQGVLEYLKEKAAINTERAIAAGKETEARINQELVTLEPLYQWLARLENQRRPEWTQKAQEYFSKANEIIGDAPQGTPIPEAVIAPLAKGLWVGSQDSGLLFFANDGERRHYTAENSILPSNNIAAIVSGPSGETWIGTTEAGLLRYHPYTVSRTKDVETVWTGDCTTLRLAGNLFIGTGDQGLLAFDPRTLTQEAHYHPGTVPGFHRRVNDLGIDSQARLWVAGDQGVWMRENGNWRQVSATGGLASDSADVLSIRDRKVVAAAGDDLQVNRQISYFNGQGFVSYAPETVLALCQDPATPAVDLLLEMGCLGGYARTLTATDPKSLERYRVASVASRISALLDTDQYLLIGTEGGELFLFDGEAFKNVSSKGTGRLGPLVGLKQCPNEDQIIAGRDRLLLFDGKAYQPIPLTGLPTTARITDLVLDDRDRQVFWISYTSPEGSSGMAVYQKPTWKSMPQKEPVRRLALSDPYVFFATPNGVFRQQR